MEKERLLPISIIALAISIPIGASIISQGIKDHGVDISSSIWQVGSSINDINNSLHYDSYYEEENLDLSEAARYLRIPESQLILLTKDTSSGIPHIKINNLYVFNKNAIDKWLETAIIELD